VPLVASQLLAAANKWSIRKALVESLSSARRRKRERMRKAEMPSKINFFRFLEKSDIFEKFLLGGASVDDSRSYSSWGGFRFILELLCKKMSF